MARVANELDAHDFDGFWKEALDLALRDVVRLASPDAEAAIDWDAGVEAVDKEFQPAAPDESAGVRFVDKLARVRLKTGEDGVLFVHVEVQSAPDAEFAARMFGYWTRIREKFARPIVSIAVLADEDPGWRPRAFELSAFGTVLRFEFSTVKLADFGSALDDLETSGNALFLLIAAERRTRHTRPDETRLSAKTRLARALLRDSRFTPENVRKLWRLLTWLLRLPDDLDARFEAEIRRMEGPRMEILCPMEVRAMEKGRTEGRVDTVRDTIARVARARFGSEPEFLARLPSVLGAMSDPGVLDRWFDLALAAATREEFERGLVE